MVVKEVHSLDQRDGNGPPVQTNITLNFKELEIITRERIGAGY